MKRYLANTVLLLASLCFAAALSEILIRLAVSSDRWQYWDLGTEVVHDDDAGFVYRPNLKTHINGISFSTNADSVIPGSARRKRRKGVRRILLFGDSTVAGRRVDEPGRLHRQLERVLRSQGIEAEVFNAGVPGYSTDQSLVRMQHLIPLYKPDVVTYVFCTNDYAQNASPEIYGVTKKTFSVSPSRRLVVQPRAEGGSKIVFGPQGLARWYRQSALYQLAKNALVPILARHGVLREVHYPDVVSAVYGGQMWNASLDQLLEYLLREMKQTATRNGAHFLFYKHPDAISTWPPEQKQARETLPNFDPKAGEAHLAKIGARAHVSFCPLVEYFATQVSRGPFHLLPRDPHANATGYAVTAERLVQCLKQEGVF